jgi:hypothetical protein
MAKPVDEQVLTMGSAIRRRNQGRRSKRQIVAEKKGRHREGASLCLGCRYSLRIVVFAVDGGCRFREAIRPV